MNHTNSATASPHPIASTTEAAPHTPFEKTESINNSENSTLILDAPIAQEPITELPINRKEPIPVTTPSPLIALSLSGRPSEIINSRAEIVASIEEADAEAKERFKIQKTKREEGALAKINYTSEKVLKIESERPC